MDRGAWRATIHGALSSRVATRVSWSPLSGLKGVQPPLPFGEKKMATHPSILAWRIPWTEEPGVLQSMGLQRGGHNLVIKMATPTTAPMTVLWREDHEPRRRLRREN